MYCKTAASTKKKKRKIRNWIKIKPILMVSETLVQVLWTCNTFALSLNPASLAQCFAETINYCMVRCEEKYLAICSLHAKFQAYDVTLIIVTFSREINLQAWEWKKENHATWMLMAHFFISPNDANLFLCKHFECPWLYRIEKN